MSMRKLLKEYTRTAMETIKTKALEENMLITKLKTKNSLPTTKLKKV